MGDLIHNNSLKSIENILDMGINLNNFQYTSLKQGWQAAKQQFGKNAHDSKSLVEFLGSFKKGSKKFREILMQKIPSGKLNNLQQVKTFKKITGIENLSEDRLKSMHSAWTANFIDAKTRDFMFKYHNNLLGTNQRVNKFNPEIDPSCTFCNLAHTLPAPLETFEHIFYTCPVVNKTLEKMFEKYFNIG
jgi:hypothetical protein